MLNGTPGPHLERTPLAIPPNGTAKLKGAVTDLSPKVAPAPLPAAPSLAEVAREIARRGALPRLRTTLKTLDDDMRGGIPVPRLVILGGAPGAGKTSLAVYLGWRWALEGHRIVMLAADEGREDVMRRLVQLNGFDRNAFDGTDPALAEATWNKAADRFDGFPFEIIEPGERWGTVEGIFERASLLALEDPTRHVVLIVDSVQKVDAVGTSTAKDPRERVSVLVNAIKAGQRRAPCIVLVTSELARGAYRNKNTADQTTGLSSFKESGDIEYAAQTALVLRNVEGSPDEIDVEVAKNRSYGRRKFRLWMNKDRASFRELKAEDEVGDAGSDRTFNRLMERIVALVARNPCLPSKRRVLVALKANGAGARKDDVNEAIDTLVAQKRLVHEGVYRIVPSPGVTSTDPGGA